MFIAFIILSCILDAILMIFNPFAMRFILRPFSIIDRAINFMESSFSLSFTLHPISLINFSIGMDHPSPAAGKIMNPISFIKSTIRPDLFTLPKFLSLDHFSIKFSTIIIFVSICKNRYFGLYWWYFIWIELITKLSFFCGYVLNYVSVEMTWVEWFETIWDVLKVRFDFVFMESFACVAHKHNIFYLSGFKYINFNHL